MPNSFVNPYTFIPLGQGVKGSRQVNATTGSQTALSGVIACKLIAKTEIAIPDKPVSCDGDGDNEAFSFFSVAGRPIIPGSSIRGAIRSMYEALTDSCMNVSNERLHSMSGMKAPGLLERESDGSYRLHKAVRYRVKNAALQGHETGEKVRFDYKDGRKGAPGIVTSDESGPFTGWFLKAHAFGAGKKTSSPSVFEMDGDSFAVDSKYVDALEDNIRMYVENNDGSEVSAAYQRCFGEMKRAAGQLLPVWYARDGASFQFAPSQISRSVYSKRPSDFASEMGLSPCESTDDCCAACALFGFVSGETARASAIRFGDAEPIGSVSRRWAFLPNLMEPRASSFEFYLRNDRKGRERSFTPETEGAQLAGRKAYWHHQGGLTREQDGWTGYNAKIELVGPGAEFEFQVFFDCVSQEQLNQLVYVLSLGQAWDEGRDEVRCHKIGHGKPAGLGSVLIQVDNIVVRTQNHNGYQIHIDNTWKWELDQVERTFSHVNDVKRVTAFEAIDADALIDYPREVKNGDIFAWFADNRDRFARGAAQNYCIVLPHIQESQLLLRDPKSAARQFKKRDIAKSSSGRFSRGAANSPGRVSSVLSSKAGDREYGTVVEYHSDRKFGFIAVGDTKRIFFHEKKWPSGSTPREQQAVSFVRAVNKEGKNRGKPYADDIRLEQ